MLLLREDSKVRLLRKNRDHMQIVRTCICPQLNSGEEHDIRGFGAQTLNALPVNRSYLLPTDNLPDK